MVGIGQTLTEDAGPLPIWAWAGIGTAAVGGYLLYRKKQSVTATQAAQDANATSSNLGTVPVSNLSVQAEPMPIQMGDTFVTQAQTQTQATPAPTPAPAPAPTKTTTPTTTPSKVTTPTAAAPTISESAFDTFVGQFTSALKLKTPSPAAVAAYTKANGGDLTPASHLKIQAWNIGQLTSLNNLKTPTKAQINAKALQMFPSLKSMDFYSQQLAIEEANLTLLRSLNPKA